MRVQEDPLEPVLRAARAGDEEAFAVLWRTLHPALLRYLRGRGDRAPDDLAAETWLHVVRGLDAFEGDVDGFRAWLFTIARHRAVDAGRARGRRPEEPVAQPSPPREAAPSAAELVEEDHATERALALVGTLPAAQAEMVLLRVVGGLDVADVARIVGRRPGAVRTAVHRALRTLAETVRSDQTGAWPGAEEVAR